MKKEIIAPEETRKAFAAESARIENLNNQADKTTDQNALGELYLQGADLALPKITDSAVLTGLLGKAAASQKEQITARIINAKKEILDGKVAKSTDQNILIGLYLEGADGALEKITSQTVLRDLLDKEKSIPKRQKILLKIRNTKKLDQIIDSNMPAELRNQALQQRFGK